jgi:hypothetical protein
MDITRMLEPQERCTSFNFFRLDTVWNMDASSKQYRAVAIADHQPGPSRALSVTVGAIHTELDPSHGGSLPQRLLSWSIWSVHVPAMIDISNWLFTFGIRMPSRRVKSFAQVSLEEDGRTRNGGVSLMMDNIIPEVPSPPEKEQDSGFCYIFQGIK